MVDKPSNGANVCGSYMKIAYITLLAFTLFVAYGTLTNHTRAVQSIHYDNQMMIMLLTKIGENTNTIVNAIDRVPVPMPMSSSTSNAAKIANKDEIPIRKAEIVQ